MKSKISKIGIVLSALLLPLFTYADEPFTSTKQIFAGGRYILTTYLIPIAFSLALLYFFYGVAQYIRSAGDKEEGKKIMVWGVVALFVMSSVWGLIYFIQDELLIGTDTAGTIPTIE